ncbi:MAG: hypothetical protein ACLSVD_15490 [Eggerthellaceae bacterium]
MWDYIATRSLFPSTFKAAVRQKARWVYGITMQSASMADVFGKSELTFAERTFLYKDSRRSSRTSCCRQATPCSRTSSCRRSRRSWSCPSCTPLHSPSWWMCVFLLFMMVERQVLRGRALANVYGWKTMAFSILLPPLFPLRLLWGNLINMCATLAHGGRRSPTCCCADESQGAAAPVVEHRGNAAEEEGEGKPATDGDDAQTSNATPAQEGPA